ncbi:MAG TPA: Gfo/Idh/MocA family oxidoreductase [Chloroflexia bacterium]|nr:Gfo/Idh/MocA family oxidoreductase [Chloroflexia bacterium]
MRIAIVGCGFVADYYMSTLPAHPELELIGVADRVQERAQKFSNYHKVKAYASLDELLADPQVEIVLNLTNPRNHYEVSKAALEAGKHVYSEKPLAMEMKQACELVELAEQKGLQISSAPCSLLGETAQTIWKALRENAVGKVRVVYAEMDEGLVHLMPFKKWASESGTPWPYKDEFEVGTTIEHAGYVVTWLPAFFGPVESIYGFSACLIPDKVPGEPLVPHSPDFAVAVLRFSSGIVARLTCSLIAPHDHSLMIVGDKGVMRTDDTWFYTAPVYTRKSFNLLRKHIEIPWKFKYKLVSKGERYKYRGVQQMDFSRGPAELATAITEGRPSRLSARYSLHINEIVLAVNNALDGGGVYHMTTTFDPPEPVNWSK